MSTDKEGQAGAGKARVLLVDDHPVVRSGLAQLINEQADLCVCGEADEPSAALKAIATMKPDVAIIDLSLNKDIGGIELIKDVSVRFPKVRVLVLSMHDEMMFAERVLRSGARGYIMKGEAMSTVLTAIRRLVDGEIYLSDRMAKRMLANVANKRSEKDMLPVERLTDRELQVLELIGRGFGTSQIAEKLFLSVKTVETYRARIKEKLKLEDSGAMLQYAIQWVQSENVM